MKDEKSKKSGLLDVLFRRDVQVHTVTGNQQGDVEVSGDVRVEASAFLEGNVRAARVDVVGRVRGSIIAGTLTIVSGGEVWGNVLAETIHIEPGGSLRGWMVTVNEQELADAFSGDVALSQWSPDEQLEEAAAHQPPFSAWPEADAEMRPYQRALLHRLQDAAGRALAAYHELQQAFEERLHDAAGEAISRAATLEEDLTAARRQISRLEERLDGLRSTSEEQAEELADAHSRLADLQDLLEERGEAVEQLKARDESQLRNLAELEERNERLREQLDRMARYATSSSHRLESLENALQATIQQSSEQEEVLIHWQKLATTTQEQVGHLEEDLRETRRKLEESQEAVRELTGVRAELERKIRKTPEEPADPGPRAAEKGSPDNDVKAPVVGDSAAGQAVQSGLQEQLHEQEDQLLWYRTALTATRDQLETVQAKLEEKEELLEKTRSELAVQLELGEKWQGRVGHLSELLYEASRQIKEKEEALEKAQEDRGPAPDQSVPFEVSALRQLLRERDLQLDGLEAEVEQYRQDLEAQSRRLAETRAELAELHLQLQAAEPSGGRREDALRGARENTGPEIGKAEAVPKEAGDKEGEESDLADGGSS